MIDYRFDDDGVAQIVLARVDARNAIDLDWVHGLSAAASACASNDQLRAVLITADGPAFTVGGDLAYLRDKRESLAPELDRMITPFHDALRTIAELPAPVVCAAHGAVAGGGLGLLWCSDVVLLAEGCKLATGFSRLGLSGDGGSSWYLPRLIGLRRAVELLIEGRALDAHEAVEWGLATRVLAASALGDEALSVARQLAAGPTRAYAEMRELLRGSFERHLGEGLDAEGAAMQRCAGTADAVEGIGAFIEHRAPRFEGR
ncbi:MAG: enoyl-CoA hydratase/isomerase family protein [Solirubrobacteraceae bacterium]